MKREASEKFCLFDRFIGESPIAIPIIFLISIDFRELIFGYFCIFDRSILLSRRRIWIISISSSLQLPHYTWANLSISSSPLPQESWEKNFRTCGNIYGVQHSGPPPIFLPHRGRLLLISSKNMLKIRENPDFKAKFIPYLHFVQEGAFFRACGKNN